MRDLLIINSIIPTMDIKIFKLFFKALRYLDKNPYEPWKIILKMDRRNLKDTQGIFAEYII